MEIKAIIALLEILAGAYTTKKVISVLDEELNFPNIKMPTIGGKTFWITLAEVNGWRFQQNDLTKHARILNPDNVRVAWGTVHGMEKVMRRLGIKVPEDI